MAERARRRPEIRSAKRVHTYWPRTEHREADRRPLIGWMHERGVEVVLPVVTQYPPAPPAMEHRLFRGREATEPNRWGIPEPVGTRAVDPATIDVVLVPALGAGRNGHRVGHGTGYYDAFLRPLADAGVPRVALVFDDCLVDAVPADAHDVPVSAIVTEHQTVSLPS